MREGPSIEYSCVSRHFWRPNDRVPFSFTHFLRNQRWSTFLFTTMEHSSILWHSLRPKERALSYFTACLKASDIVPSHLMIFLKAQRWSTLTVHDILDDPTIEYSSILQHFWRPNDRAHTRVLCFSWRPNERGLSYLTTFLKTER